MAIVALPLPPGAEARALLHHLLKHGDVVGRDNAGRTIIQLAVDDRVLEKLMTFDAEAAELEDEGETEPDDDAEEDRPPLVLLEVMRPEVAKRGLESVDRSRPKFVDIDAGADTIVSRNGIDLARSLRSPRRPLTRSTSSGTGRQESSLEDGRLPGSSKANSGSKG